MMNNYLKQVAYMIIVSTIFSFIRYLLIYEDYSLIKKSKTIDTSSISENLDLEDLKKYLINIEKPEVIDIELTKTVSETVSIPIIASGGVGNLDHLSEGILYGKADAVLAASIFHFGEYSITDAKKKLFEKNIEVRI